MAVGKRIKHFLFAGGVLLAVVLIGLFLWTISKHDSLLSDRKLEYALSLSGGNRPSLEAALRRYAKEGGREGLKYRAARYLIENMPGHYGYESDLLDNYLQYYSVLKSSRKEGKSPKSISDQFARLYGPLHLDADFRAFDISAVDSSYLCREIDFVFDVWKREPWGKNVRFEDLCRYVLPYRIGNEKLSDWREYYYGKYSTLLDDFRQNDSLSSDPGRAALELCRLAMPFDSLYYTSTVPSSLPNAGPLAVENLCGTCRELGDFMIYLCRALCIPVRSDFMPLRGDDNVGHSWISFEDSSGTLYCQEFGRHISPVNESAPYRQSKIKVYRQLFDSPSALMDVTESYTDSLVCELKIPRSMFYDGEIPSEVWLCQYSNGRWQPVVKGRKRLGVLMFTNLCRGDIFRMAEVNSKWVKPVSDPMFIDYSGKLSTLTPASESEDVVLYSKFPLNHEYHFFRRTLNGVFEGSQNKDFSDADTLAVIEELPYRRITKLKARHQGPYRYLRYRGADGTCSHIADVFFYGLDGKRIEGRPIGSAGSRNNDAEKTYLSALDGNNRTSFEYSAASGGWCGLALGNPQGVSAVAFTPPNLDSFVVEGHEFELLYCDRGWKSAGKVRAEADSVIFHNVPKNSLLTLRNLTRGRHEFIFTYRDGQQRWSR